MKDAAPEKPFIIVVSGASNVGKSALIKQAHHKLRLAETTTASKFNVSNPYQTLIVSSLKPILLLDDDRSVHMLTIEDMMYSVELIELSIDMFDTSLDPLQLPKVSISYCIDHRLTRIPFYSSFLYSMFQRSMEVLSALT